VKKSLNILILEDNPLDVELILRELSRQGFEVTWQSVDNEAGFRSSLNSNLDIILADFRLPQFDADMALSILKEQKLDIPFILITGTLGEEAAVERIKRGAEDFLLKDNLVRLDAVVTHALEQRKLRREKEQAEIALRESEALFRMMTDTAPVMIWIAGIDAARSFFNKTWLNFRGRTLEQELGNGWTEGLHPQDLQNCLGTYRSSVEARKPFQMEFRFKNADGSYHWVLDTGVPRFTEAHQFLGYIGSCLDITERKKVESMKSEFISTVSHELKTPLTSIRTSLELLKCGTVPKREEDLIDIAFRNSHRLLRLINDVLDIQKIESGKMDFFMSPLEIAPLIRQAIEVNHFYEEKFGIEFVIEQTIPDIKINADADRIIQVLTNFLSNAAKFSMKDKKVLISVAENKKNIRVSVKNHGPGIPKEFHHQIFQKFSQVDASDARKREGTGLGLWISKELIENMGGEIGFESPNDGDTTTFYFDLPVWHEKEPLSALSNSASKGSMHILVCEDERDIALLISMILMGQGFKTDIALNASQAKKKLIEGHYDAMTLDIALPDQDGISLVRELREREDMKNLPVIIVSAKARQARQDHSENCYDIVDWIEKPIHSELLIASIRQAVQKTSH
jgi:PAS domain S-box-containing protein